MDGFCRWSVSDARATRGKNKCAFGWLIRCEGISRTQCKFRRPATSTFCLVVYLLVTVVTFVVAPLHEY